MQRSIWAAVAVLLVASTAAHSQSTASDPASDPAAERQAFIDKMRALDWVKGPTTVEVEGNSKLVIPDQYVFLDARNTTKFLELQHNLGDGREVMVAPSNMEWMAYLEFSAEGYVKDNEKIDASALLKTLQENTESSNEQRKSRGWSELHLVDWATPPVYNTTTKRLEWATILDSKEGGRAVNFSTKILGRRGYTSVIMVTDPVNLQTAESGLDNVLTGYAFNSGETYADWRSGDKVAKYGLAALIVGGVAAVAAKKGLFSVLAGFLAAAWKFIMIGVVAAVAWLRKLFAKKQA
ncbi:MAG: hypothetical protein QOI59_3583 [Gammaproteobacteria bacterium]|jgi:uncharacterized membrane-anchored protein|nr:hypothetical protein [Gammaproteobacteria bacterium]